VFRNKLDGIAEEMELALIRSSFSPVVKESMDASAGLFTADGQTLAQATAVPLHLGTLVPAVGQIIATFPVRTMVPGDAYVMNDPYCGGTHLPDLAVVAPVFADGRVVALSCAMTHHQDIGGMAPGSVPTNATEIFQEGLRIPALKLRNAQGWNETLLALLRLNVRQPEMFMGDLNAQIAACSIGVRRLGEVLAGFGADGTEQMFVKLMARSEALTRQAIRALPQGVHRYVDFLDNDGVVLDRRVRVEVAVIVEDDSITFNFTGTSPQVRGPINVVPSGVLAAAYYAVRALTGPQIPTNGGCFRPIKLVLPEGSLMNPRAPAAVNTRTVSIKIAAACMVNAIRNVIPGCLPASDAVDMHGIVWSGVRADGSRFVLSEMIAGGSGARPNADGIDTVETDVTNCMNLPVEVLELSVPIRVVRAALRKDSGGAGRYRGGLGVIREYEMLEGPVRVGHRGERFYSRAPGLGGGEAGTSAISVIKRRGSIEEIIPSKSEFTLEAGDRLVLETAGGAGHGDVLLRDPALVAADVRAGKVSAEAARDIYGLDEADGARGPTSPSPASRGGRR
jgi:N-methylhydantoinase B/oxoprolinase/acetone carboxylase alpha subunit